MDLPIEIKPSRSWLWFFFTLAILFCLLGLAFLLIPHTMRSPLMQHDLAIRLVGLVIFIASGLFLKKLVKRVYKQQPGLVIERTGLIDNSSSLSVGWIDWADVTAIRKVRIANVRVLMLDTSRPEKYIKRAKTTVARSARQAHQKFYGSPIAITVSSLQIPYNRLEQLLEKAFKAHREKQETP